MIVPIVVDLVDLVDLVEVGQMGINPLLCDTGCRLVKGHAYLSNYDQ